MAGRSGWCGVTTKCFGIIQRLKYGQAINVSRKKIINKGKLKTTLHKTNINSQGNAPTLCMTKNPSKASSILYDGLNSNTKYSHMQTYEAWKLAQLL